MQLEIGGGTLLTPGFLNLDYIHGSGEWKRYAQDTPWPTGDNTVAAIRASHVLEHISAGADRIAVMNEAHRVLKPGGTFEIVVPCVMIENQMVNGWWAWADPDHKSYWAYPHSWLYFTGEFAPNADYGIRAWKTLDQENDCHIEMGWEAHVTLRKP